MEIVSQREQWGMDEEPKSELPSEEKIAAALRAPTPFSGPARVQDHD